jgi:hypothetical protein
MSKHTDPGPEPANATPKERDRWRRAQERFLTDGGKAGVSDLPAKVDPTDKRIAELQADHRNFMSLHSPMKMSLWLALMRPASDIIHDAEMSRRFRADQASPGSGGEHVAPRKPAIVEIQLVNRALMGDTDAIARIAERIEGRVGVREGDTDPDSPDAQKTAQLITEKLVRALTGKRIEESTVIDVTSTDVTPVEESK